MSEPQHDSDECRSRFVLAFVFGSACLALVDTFAFARVPWSAPAALCLLTTLAFPLGLACFHLRDVRKGSILVLGLALGLLLAFQVDAHAKLLTQPSKALSALISLPILVTAAIGATLSVPRLRRRSVALAALMLSLGCVWCLRELLLPLLYPPFGVAMACFAIALAGVALVVFAQESLPFVPLRRAGLAVLAAWLVSSFLPAEAFRGLGHRGVARPMLAVSRAVSDVDFDGSSALFGDGDCAPFDDARGRHALEIPGDGIDQNCLEGDGEAQAPGSVVNSDQQTNLQLAQDSALGAETGLTVLLLTIDTVRYDRTSLANAANGTTPRLAEFAAGAMRFPHAYAGGAWTSIALATVLWGQPARRLQWRQVFETNRLTLVPAGASPPTGEVVQRGFLVVDEQGTSLASRVQRRGLHTAAVVDGGHTGFLKPEGGFADGFDHYEALENAGDAATVARLIELLDAAESTGPAFLWGHLFGPHSPDQHHSEVRDFGSDMRGRYDHELAVADGAMGQLFDHVAHRQDLVVVVTADHGEAFGPFFRAHGQALNEEMLRVPLLISGPGFEASRADGVACHSDIAPTILAVLFEGAQAGDLRTRALGHLCVADTWRLDSSGDASFDFAGVAGPNGLWVRELLSGESWWLAGAHGASREEAEYARELDAYLDASLVRGGRLLARSGFAPL